MATWAFTSCASSYQDSCMHLVCVEQPKQFLEHYYLMKPTSNE